MDRAELKRACFDVRQAALSVLSHAPMRPADAQKYAKAIEDAYRLEQLRREGVPLRTVACKAAECRVQFNVPMLNGQYACPTCGIVMELSFRDEKINESITKA